MSSRDDGRTRKRPYDAGVGGKPRAFDERTLGTTPEELGALQLRIVEAGHPISVALGITGWLVAQQAGVLTFSRDTVGKYRRILRDLGDTPTPGGQEKPRSRREAGRGRVGVAATSAALSAGVAVAMATANPAAGAAVAAALKLTERRPVPPEVLSTCGELQAAA